MLYRSPSNISGSPEFESFLKNFEELHVKIKSENPYAMFFAGDFNGHSQLWWSGGNTTLEGTRIHDLTNFLGLTQLITEPTNSELNKTPSCIELIFMDYSNRIPSWNVAREALQIPSVITKLLTVVLSTKSHLLQPLKEKYGFMKEQT